jgi:hypothetical protein
MSHPKPKRSTPVRLGGAVALAGAALAAASLGGCASIDPDRPEQPQWFKEKRVALNDKGFPDVRAIPEARAGGRTAAEWAAIEADVRAAGQAVVEDPRGAPADLSWVPGFEADARKAASPPPLAPNQRAMAAEAEPAPPPVPPAPPKP